MIRVGDAVRYLDTVYEVTRVHDDPLDGPLVALWDDDRGAVWVRADEVELVAEQRPLFWGEG